MCCLCISDKEHIRKVRCPVDCERKFTPDPLALTICTFPPSSWRGCPWKSIFISFSDDVVGFSLLLNTCKVISSLSLLAVLRKGGLYRARTSGPAFDTSLCADSTLSPQQQTTLHSLTTRSFPSDVRRWAFEMSERFPRCSSPFTSLSFKLVAVSSLSLSFAYHPSPRKSI
jgi:hypothetical protein